MRRGEFVIEATREAMREAFRYARAVPAERLAWRPLDAGRSALDLARELAKCPDRGLAALGGEGMNEEPEAGDAERESWATVEACEAAGEAKLQRFLAVVAAFPDERLEETVELPYGEGGAMRSFTMAEMMDHPRWNASYHQGQLAYLQTLYGDGGLH